MKKRNLLIGIGIIIILFFASGLFLNNITGKASSPPNYIYYECFDSDDGEDYYKKGKITFFKYFHLKYNWKKNYQDILLSKKTYEDRCNPKISENFLIEYKCSQENKIKRKAVSFECPNGCENGACVE